MNNCSTSETGDTEIGD